MRKKAAKAVGHSILRETTARTRTTATATAIIRQEPSRKDIFIAGGFGARAAGHLLAYKYREGHQQADLSSVEFEFLQ